MDTLFGRAIYGNVLLWSRGVGAAWDRISLTEKATWIFFLANTIALITATELLLFRRP